MLLIGSAGAAAGLAEQVACRVTYGGETLLLRAPPVANALAVYDAAPVAIGSYFLFRIVFQRNPASEAAINLYTYADREQGPVIIHQARYTYPPRRQRDHGFTGLHWVYEPVRDGELQYWCELESGRAP
ncbi:MAG: hypothetical protein ABI574_01540 [Burkholderiales bacterium]